MKPPVNPVGSWDEYFASTRDLPLHPQYLALEPYLPTRGRVLELGCGVGTGARWLAAQGLEVLAVDALPEAIAAAQAFPTPKNLTYACAYMQNLELPPATYDVVVAGFCLFFLPREDFVGFWPRLIAALRPGGLFMGQFLGPRDAWAPGYLTHSREEVEALFSKMEIFQLEEVERDGKTSQGTAKHWHVLHVIAQALST